MGQNQWICPQPTPAVRERRAPVTDAARSGTCSTSVLRRASSLVLGLALTGLVSAATTAAVVMTASAEFALPASAKQDLVARYGTRDKKTQGPSRRGAAY